MTARAFCESLDSLMIASMAAMSCSSRGAWVALLLAGASALVAARAEAQLSDEDRARIHFQTGTSYYDQGRYLDAAQQFRDSYRLSGRAHLLLNVARCLELGERYGEAADALEEYLQAEPGAADRRTLEQRITSLRARAGPQDAEAGATPSGDGPDLTAPAILLGIGGALALGGLGTGIATLEIQSSIEGMCTADRVCPAELRGDADTGQALAITTDVLLGTAIVAAGIGTALLIVALGEGGEDEAVTPTASCGPSGCMAGARGRLW